MSRICDNCRENITASEYGAYQTGRLREQLGLRVTVHIDGVADICKNCMEIASIKAYEAALKSLDSMIDKQKVEGNEREKSKVFTETGSKAK